MKILSDLHFKWLKVVGKYTVYMAFAFNLTSLAMVMPNVAKVLNSVDIEHPSIENSIKQTSVADTSSGLAVKKKIQVEITAFSSTPDQTDDTPFTTASGKNVKDGIVAANFLPFGTRIQIPSIYGDKIFVVEDRMNRRYTDRVDVWQPDRESAKNFGIKTAEIIVL